MRTTGADPITRIPQAQPKNDRHQLQLGRNVEQIDVRAPDRLDQVAHAVYQAGWMVVRSPET